MADLKEFYDKAKIALVKPITALENELKKIRGARASSALVENIKVEVSGRLMPIKSLATITIPEPRTIIISPWDKSNLGAIEKAILKENINLTPSNDGKVIRLVLPQLTEETRKDMVKMVKQKVEESKVAVRNVRRDFIDKVKKMEKNGEITEDERHEAEAKLQDYTNKVIKKIDEIFKRKEKEIMTV